MSTETMTTTAPSTDAPRLTRAQTDYMALTAPEDAEPSIGDLFHIYRKAERESLLAADPKRSYYARADMLAGVQAVRDAAIAAAEPLFRARHRAELLAEMAEAADRDPIDLLLNIPNGISAINAGAVTAEWLRQQADATRPVEGRGVK